MDKYIEIIEHYGVNHQLKKLSEEVFELEEAILEKHSIDHITEEFADVQVLLEQIKKKFELDPNRIDSYMNGKVRRQMIRMLEEEE